METKWFKENLIHAVEISLNKSEVLKNLGLKSYTGNYDTLNKYLKKYNINTSHFKRINKNIIKKEKTPLNEILISGSTYSRTHLKKRLYDEGLKEPICELCGQDEIWQGKKMSLILDHINGINNDHRLENLRIVCPNCNATLPTHCGKNVLDRKLINRKKRQTSLNYCKCGKIIRHGNNKCIICHNNSQRKVKRPPYEQLLDEIKENGYSATGRKYGVSDNAIRKWVKFYENQH